MLDEIVNKGCFLAKEDGSWLCHRRMEHINFDNLFRIIKKEVVREISRISKPTSTSCKHCKHGKHTRVEFKSKEHSSSKPLDLVNIDLCGPIKNKGLNGEQYFMLTIDNHTIMTTVSFLKKYEAFECLRIYKEMVENEIYLKIKCLRLDNGGEFTYK